MIVAGVLIETVPGAAPIVAGRLVHVPGLTLEGGDGSGRIAAVIEASDGAALEALTERLVRDDDGILGVYPTFVGTDADAVGTTCHRTTSQPPSQEKS